MKNRLRLLSISAMFVFILSGCSKAQNKGPEAVTPPIVVPPVSNGNTVSLIDNGTVWKDTNGDEIHAQGGNIIQEGTTFHWFGMQYPIWKAVNHYTSTDLKTWTKQSPALTPGMAGIPFGATNWVGRPFVMKNPNPGQSPYVMTIEWALGSATVRNRFCFLTATSLDGPWTFQASKTINNLPNKNGVLQQLGDLGAFADGNTAYLAYTFDYPEANYSRGILKLGPDFMTPLSYADGDNYEEFTGASGVSWQINEVREAAAIIKRGSTYYYFTSKCAGWPSSQTGYRTSTTVTSATNDWSAPALIAGNPSTSNSYNTQHDFVIPITGTTATTYMYAGDRWNNMNGTIGGVGKYHWSPFSFSSTGVPTMNAPNHATDGGDWKINITTGEVVP